MHIEIKVNDIVIGAEFQNPSGTVFIIDAIEDYPEYRLIRSSLKGGAKGNYRDEINDFVLFLNEQKCTKQP